MEQRVLCTLCEMKHTEWSVSCQEGGIQNALYDISMGAHTVVLMIVSLISLLCLIPKKGHTEYSAQCQEATKQSTLYGLFKVLYRVLCMVHTECILSLTYENRERRRTTEPSSGWSYPHPSPSVSVRLRYHFTSVLSKCPLAFTFSEQMDPATTLHVSALCNACSGPALQVIDDL